MLITKNTKLITKSTKLIIKNTKLITNNTKLITKSTYFCLQIESPVSYSNVFLFYAQGVR